MTTAFFTFAYNAEKTLSHAVESILAQTIDDWTYYLVDDGSLDGTAEQIAKYAKQDNRIIPVFMEKNDPYEASRIGFKAIFEGGYDYFCMLDADDAYKKDFLERTLSFMTTHDLMICACGSDFIEAKSGRIIGKREIESNLVLQSGKDYDTFFRLSHQFMRTIWGKLYDVALFKNFDYLDDSWDYYNVAYGGDTIFFMKAAQYADKIGIISGTEHQYYMSEKSVSYSWNPKRPDADTILHNRAVEFLMRKTGYISSQNRQFLNIVYVNAVRDTTSVLLHSHVSAKDRYHVLREIFSSAHMVRFLENGENTPEEFNSLINDVFKAVDRFENAKKMDDGIWLGMTLSAFLGLEDKYIAYSLSNIENLINNGNVEAAKAELVEWESLLGNNSKISKLRFKLSKAK